MTELQRRIARARLLRREGKTYAESWLDLVGVPEQSRSYRLTLHESADVSQQESWWASQLQVPLAAFARATMKKHNPRAVRHNVGDAYHGCLVVSVAASSGLYYSIEGWWSRLVEP